MRRAPCRPRGYFNTSPSTRGFRVFRLRWRVFSFQYQPLHEGLPPARRHEKDCLISIPAPPRGASTMPTRWVRAWAFQYQPLHEGLRRSRQTSSGRRDFNTSPSTRGFRRACPSADDTYFNTSPSTRGFGGDS